MSLKRSELLEFMRSIKFATEASVNAEHRPQAAIVGVIVNEYFEVFFDTLRSSRKAQNLQQNANVAFVFYHAAKTLQFEGVVDFPLPGDELNALTKQYFESFPDGKQRQQEKPDLIYIRARPTWIRYSDYTSPSSLIVEFTASELEQLK